MIEVSVKLVKFSPEFCVQECQLQFHRGMLESFTADLSDQQQNVLDAKKAKAKDLEEHRVRTEYLQHEVLKLL